MYNDALYVRLHNCLQTILELEPTFSENTFENCAELKELFAMLKDSLANSTRSNTSLRTWSALSALWLFFYMP